MRIRSLTALTIATALLAAASAMSAQAPPKVVPACDPKDALGHSPTGPGVLRATIVKACPEFEKGGENFTKANFDTLTKLNGVQSLGLMLHGDVKFFTPPPDTAIVPPAPPKDTATPPAVTPPVVTPPVVTPPSGSIANPHPMGALTAPFVVVPQGWAGRSGPDIKTGGGCEGTACAAGEGADRFLCNLAYMAFDDPIVFPGQPGASHLHQFFGNTNVTAFTTSESIATTGNGTCSGGTVNRTGYWTPAMIDANGQVVPPADWPAGGTTIYYKSGLSMQPSLVQPMPTGLKMIEGDKNWSNTKQNQDHVWWVCADGPGPDHSPVIPDCTGRVELIVVFPQCWNGRDLDSPDHKSHMAHPTFINIGGGRSTCPATHQVVVPELTELFFWPVPKGVKSSTWHLSSDIDVSKPGGLSAHADWMMGWDATIMATFVKNCLVASKDCQVNALGDNRYLNPPP